ncbi:hypothetical protein DV515_00012218 [Chloebia gouldiae]|uniref:Uncharacterized protein n=1 Tax=Chloebia gouldiae TaxID=44316 RepID=A0A3L8S439_CHLGU|nr:hypothetical protein DV515_00012218 [Chloebia gouldiae]
MASNLLKVSLFIVNKEQLETKPQDKPRACATSQSYNKLHDTCGAHVDFKFHRRTRVDTGALQAPSWLASSAMPLGDLCTNEGSGDQVFDTDLKEYCRNLFFIQQLVGEDEDFTLRHLMCDREAISISKAILLGSDLKEELLGQKLRFWDPDIINIDSEEKRMDSTSTRPCSNLHHLKMVKEVESYLAFNGSHPDFSQPLQSIPTPHGPLPMWAAAGRELERKESINNKKEARHLHLYLHISSADTGASKSIVTCKAVQARPTRCFPGNSSWRHSETEPNTEGFLTRNEHGSFMLHITTGRQKVNEVVGSSFLGSCPYRHLEEMYLVNCIHSSNRKTTEDGNDIV